MGLIIRNLTVEVTLKATTYRLTHSSTSPAAVLNKGCPLSMRGVLQSGPDGGSDGENLGGGTLSQTHRCWISQQY